MNSKRKKVKRDIYDDDYIGLVEDTNDPKKIGRAKVRIEALHGRSGDKNSIPTADLPWLEPSSRGNSFGLSSIGKVVYVSFENGDYYKGSYFADEHYDINLQEKLDSLSSDVYQNFFSMYFDAKHQYFYEDNVGIMFDYMKSNINMRDNGDIRINLKDNSAKLFLGTEDASQQAMLGNHWIDWFDELVQNLMGGYGGPYLGNLSAPVLPHPKMIECLNKYLAIKQTFLSDHVFIVDDQKVKPQKRKFDKLQSNDNWNTEDLQKTNNAPSTIPEPISRKESGGNPPDATNVPPSNFSDNLGTTILPDNPTSDDKLRTIKPFTDNTENGKIPVENMTPSKYLSTLFSDENDERKYLLDEASKSLDLWLDAYQAQKASDWDNIQTTKGYQNFERQENTRKQYPTKAPKAGEDPYGFGNQAELYFGIDKNDADLTQLAKDYLSRGSIDPNATRMPQIEALDWLSKNSESYGWKNAGRTNLGDVQWWHWIYVGGGTKTVEPVKATEDVDVVFRGNGYYFKKETQGPKNRIVAYRESDKSVANTGAYSFSASLQTLIDEMKLSLNIPLDSASKPKSNANVFKINTRAEISKMSDEDLEARFQQNMLDTDKLNDDINAERISEEEYEKTLASLEEEKRIIESEKQDRLESKMG